MSMRKGAVHKVWEGEDQVHQEVELIRFRWLLAGVLKASLPLCACSTQSTAIGLGLESSPLSPTLLDKEQPSAMSPPR